MIEVKTRISAKVRDGDPKILEDMTFLVDAIRQLGVVVKQRWAEQGKPVGIQNFRGFSKRGFVKIPVALRDALGLKHLVFRNSLYFHGAARAKLGNVTGGLASGMLVRNWGTKGGILEFTGRSLSHKPRKADPDRVHKRGRGRPPADKSMAANKDKAAAIFRHFGINVLGLKGSEIDALSSLVLDRVQYDTMGALGVEMSSGGLLAGATSSMFGDMQKRGV